MAFPVRNWHNDPGSTTPLSAEALEDVEGRLGTYVESFGANVELSYAELLSTTTQTGAGSTTISALTSTVTVATRPIRVEFGCSSVYNSSASGVGSVQILEGATALQSGTISNTTANQTAPMMIAARLAPTAGSHTYTVKLTQVVTGNTTIAGAAGAPVYLLITQI